MLEPILGTAINGQAYGPVAAFPNPATDKLWIDLPQEPRSMQLFDAQGQGVPVPQMVIGASRLELNVSELLAGLYVLSMTTTTGPKTIRFVKQ